MKLFKAAAIVLCALACESAHAEPIVITALGASNTAGKGVGSNQAFPAQLEGMLRARGYEARVINAGVNGDTPQGMLARLNSSVPAGTRVVILNPGGNDLRGCRKRRGNGVCATRAEHSADVAAIVSAIRARGMRVVMAKFGNFSDDDRQADGRHLTPEAHRRVAAQLLPQVVAAIGGKAGGRAAGLRGEVAPAGSPMARHSGRRGAFGGQDGGGGHHRGACAEERRRFCNGASREECRLGRYMEQLSPTCRAQVTRNKARRQ